MKRQAIAVLVAATMFLGACSSTIQGVEYSNYGPFNENTHRNPGVEYELDLGSLFIGLILVETIIGPIYCWGFNIYKPVRLKGADPRGNGVVR